MKQGIAHCNRVKRTRIRDALTNMDDEHKDEMMRSFVVSKKQAHKIRKCGVLQKEVASKYDRKRCDDYEKLLKKMNLAMSGNKNE